MTDDLVCDDREHGGLRATAEGDGRPKCFSSTIQECLFVLTATMAIGQSSIYQGTIVGVTASIGRDLHMDSAEITWIGAGTAYVLDLLFLNILFTCCGFLNYLGGICHG